MAMISRILDWVKPDRVLARAKDEQQELFRHQIEVACNIAVSNEKIARAFFSLVETRTWDLKRLSEAVALLPIDRYEKVSRLLISMFVEADSKADSNV